MLNDMMPGEAHGAAKRLLEASILRICERAGQFFQSPACQDFTELVDQRVMNQPIRGKRLAACNLEFTACKIADFAASLLHDQHSCRSVPGIEIELPEAVEPSRRDVAEIKRSRSRPPDTVGPQCELVIEINIWILVPLLAGETGGNQTLA